MPVRKTKNWDAVGRLFSVGIPSQLETGGRDVILQNAQRYREELVQMIEGQEGDWEPLTEDWVTRKMITGGREEIYRWHDEFLNYLKSNQSQRFVKGKYASSKVFMGARADIQHRESGLSMEELGAILDYHRPLFSPAFERARDDMEQNWKNAFKRVRR